jgi:hypothetical protein
MAPMSFKEVVSRGRKGFGATHVSSAVAESESVEIDRTVLSLAGGAAPFLLPELILSFATHRTSSKRPGPKKARPTPVSAGSRCSLKPS